MSIADKLTQIAQKVPQVYAAGKQAAYDAFWDSFQQNGSKTNYSDSFGSAWTVETFKPKYSMNLSAYGALNMFSRNMINASLKQICADQGIAINFGNCVNMNGTFYGAKFTELPVIDVRKAGTNNYQTFYGMSNLETIEKLIVTETVSYNQVFQGCTALKNIVVEGVIANSLSLQWSSQLTHDSLMSFINALKDLTGTGITKTFILNTAYQTNEVINDSEKAVATNKGWTIAYAS